MIERYINNLMNKLNTVRKMKVLIIRKTPYPCRECGEYLTHIEHWNYDTRETRLYEHEWICPQNPEHSYTVSDDYKEDEKQFLNRIFTVFLTNDEVRITREYNEVADETIIRIEVER